MIFADNKENTVPNKNHNIFSNSHLASKFQKEPNPPKQPKQILNLNIKIATSSNPNTSAPMPTPLAPTQPQPQPLCPNHHKPFNNLFCTQCLTYSICRSCISSTHTQHEVMQFTSHEELINETKEILLENLEETLKELKSKENQVKNRMHQINLVRNSLRALEEDMVATISGLFREIQGQLIGVVERNQEEFNKEVDGFFTAFNDINQELRDNLMKILDGEINITQFNKSMIKRPPPQCPDFQAHKAFLQKHKKIFKDIKVELSKIKNLIEQSSSSSSFSSSTEHPNKNKLLHANSLSKFDKYFQNSMQKKEKVNPSFMKTLRLLEFGGHGKGKGTVGGNGEKDRDSDRDREGFCQGSKRVF